MVWFWGLPPCPCTMCEGLFQPSESFWRPKEGLEQPGAPRLHLAARHLPPSSTSHTRGTFGRQSRHLGRVAPDPLTTPQQGTDRGHHLSWGKQKTKNKKKLISGNKIIRGWKKPLAHRGCANMREKLLSWQNMNFFFWRRVFLPGML